MKAHHLAAAAALALPALVAAPAAAQVNGVATADPAVAIASSQAFQAANVQIGTTFQAQRTQLDQLQQQRATAMRQFDTNNDGQLSQEEQAAAQANTSAVQQVQAIEQQVEQIQTPIAAARVYVIEQIAQQLSAVFQQVVAQNNVQVVLNPGAALWSSPAMDLTDEITAALNQSTPSVSTAVPAGWQPSQQSIALFQQVQELLAAAQAQQQAAGAAQQPAQPIQGR